MPAHSTGPTESNKSTNGTVNLLPRIKILLREIVYLQDRGELDLDILGRAGYEYSFVDRLMIATHTERLKMVQEGLDVHVPPADGKTGFTLGLVPWQFKPPCEHEWYPDNPTTENDSPSTKQEHCPKCGLTRLCA